MKLIAPSILSADFTHLEKELRAVADAGADWIHIDVMDGHFVPNITMGPMIVAAVRRATDLPLDVHLMIENPDRYVPAFIKAGADYLSVHVEACTHLNRTLCMIRELGCRPGVVLNPATPLQAIEWVMADVDLILLMSVNPGFGGQSFIKNSLEKIRQAKQRIRSRGLAALIQVDGGVNRSNIADIADAGADVLVAGSAIFTTDDYKKTIDSLRREIKR